MLHVGLTGNIASGKSNASLVFAELGARVIDADSVAHQLLDPGTPTYAKVVQAFGRTIVDADGKINRKTLGRIVFNDPEKRLLLNGLVHPDVRTEIVRRIVEIEGEGRPGIVIVDAALMVESGSYELYDKLVVVYCAPELQVARLIARNSLTADEARCRMAAQLPAEEKIKLADYTIDTSGTFRETRDQIEAVYRDLVLEEIRLRLPDES